MAATERIAGSTVATPPVAVVEGAPRAVSRDERRERERPALDLCASFRDGWGQSSRRPCKWAAAGCCSYGANCYYSHAGFDQNDGKGKKKDICTFFALDIGCSKRWCADAHGEEELLERKSPHLPPGVDAATLEYYDSHCHLDGILLVHKWGQNWPYKTQLCRSHLHPEYRCYFGEAQCFFAHHEHELLGRPPLWRGDLVAFANSLPSGFVGLVQNCCDSESIRDTVSLVEWGRQVMDGKIYASFGLHPKEYFRYSDELESLLLDAFERCGDKAVAWGECGLDYSKQPTAADKVEMRRVFVRQILLAVARDVPLVVHSRDAEADVLDVLREHFPRNRSVHIHSYTGPVHILESFFNEWPQSYVGVNGVVTYETATKIMDLVRFAPLERILLETDGPFMLPEPFRYTAGGGAHPGHIPWIAKRVAELKSVPMDTVLTRTRASFRSMYGI
eukprot:TRINITY_DN38151_c0_g1_i1.p1 TRINITY_DN38151_c0_g1~~TRINITY_DN38151_c0_g1_i1.p1  ORF type:complete len:514 (+),score=65.55 TRINITY_DN38151_c0_g1_i1:201-1544(+)